MSTSAALNDRIALAALHAGDLFSFGDHLYVVTGFARTRARIVRKDSGKEYALNGLAMVTYLGRDEETLAEVEQRSAQVMNFRVGDRVRFVDNPRMRKHGLAGKEETIVRVNAKTYTMSGGYRVSPVYLEAIS